LTRQSIEAKREYRVHRSVLARRIKLDCSSISSVRTTIRACIAAGSLGVGVSVRGHARAVGRRGTKPAVELADLEAFGCAVDSVRVAARSYWHCYAALDAGQPDVGEGQRGRYRGWRGGFCRGGRLGRTRTRYVPLHHDSVSNSFVVIFAVIARGDSQG